MLIRYRSLLLALAAFTVAGGAMAAPPLPFTNTIHVTVPGTSDPYLAGMPDGSTASLTDTAPDQSPVLVPGVCLTAGDSLSFSATGGTTNYTGGTLFGPDGDTDSFQDHYTGSGENGIGNCLAPLDALIGVFLGPGQPDLSPLPDPLDFSTASPGLDFTVLAPELKQVFFIGDGLTSGAVVQKFVVPGGATRLFLGTIDGVEWLNNEGAFEVDVNGTCDVTPARAATWSALKGQYR